MFVFVNTYFWDNSNISFYMSHNPPLKGTLPYFFTYLLKFIARCRNVQNTSTFPLQIQFSWLKVPILPAMHYFFTDMTDITCFCAKNKSFSPIYSLYSPKRQLFANAKAALALHSRTVRRSPENRCFSTLIFPCTLQPI